MVFITGIYYYYCMAIQLQWAYGVTCWEVFNGGKNPYPGLNPYCVAEMIQRGERLQKPSNTACSDEMYDNNNIMATTCFNFTYINIFTKVC